MWTKLSRRELRTLFYDGRKLMLVACLVPMKEAQPRTVKALKSFGYQMTKPDGRTSDLRYEAGTLIWGGSNGNGFIEVKITDATGNETHAHYQLLPDVEETTEPLIQGVCKDCGNGTLNNTLNPQFYEKWVSLDHEYVLACKRCHSGHLDIL